MKRLKRDRGKVNTLAVFLAKQFRNLLLRVTGRLNLSPPLPHRLASVFASGAYITK